MNKKCLFLGVIPRFKYFSDYIVVGGDFSLHLRMLTIILKLFYLRCDGLGKRELIGVLGFVLLILGSGSKDRGVCMLGILSLERMVFKAFLF